MMKVKIVHISLFLLFALLSDLLRKDLFHTSRNMQFINPSYHGINMVSKAGVYYSQFNFGEGHHTLTTNTYMVILLLRI